MKQSTRETKEEIKRLLEEGYTQADVDLASRMVVSYNVGMTEYLHRYVPLNKTKRTKQSSDDKPVLKMDSTVIDAPGTTIVDIETSALTLKRCTNINTGKLSTCVVLNNVSAKTSYVDATGKPTYVIPDVLYNVLVQLLYTVNYRVQQAEKDAQYARSEAQVYKTLVDTLRKNGVID